MRREAWRSAQNESEWLRVYDKPLTMRRPGGRTLRWGAIRPYHMEVAIGPEKPLLDTGKEADRKLMELPRSGR
jgi:hypothetical protein